jgi:hypothetical protein
VLTESWQEDGPNVVVLPTRLAMFGADAPVQSFRRASRCSSRCVAGSGMDVASGTGAQLPGGGGDGRA